ncbi:putative spry domain-protein, partial [Dichotomopilus funicola]
QYAPPSGPPPSHHGGGDFAPPSGPPPGHGGDFAPPSGPPPSHHGGGDFAPPSGPPPGHNGGDFAPPSGPPPGRGDPSWIAPPPGPPPSENKPKHDWESLVPDTSLFPPPPSFFSGFDRSPAHNATEVEAEAGEAWCHAHPLHRPINLDGPAVTALRQHNPRLMQPDGFRGSLVFTGPGRWTVKTESAARDSTIIAYPPLYAVTQQHNNPSPTTTIYYEIQLHPSPANPGVGDICIALGFTALPYPSFRMPGWHRGSLAVHGDDGHRFTNDRWGGKELTKPFRAGERLGLGMTFRRSHAQSYSGGNGRRAVEVEVFLTRQGREERRWDLHEETDNEQDLPVTGLEGEHDLSCAVGTSGKTGFDVLLDPRAWMFRPEGY